MSSTKLSSSSNYANEAAKGLYIHKFLPYPVLLQYLWESSLLRHSPAHIKHIYLTVSFRYVPEWEQCQPEQPWKTDGEHWGTQLIFTQGSAIPRYIFQMNTQSRLISLLFRLVMLSLKSQQSPGAEFRWGEWLALILEFKQYWNEGQDFSSAFHSQLWMFIRWKNEGRS